MNLRFFGAILWENKWMVLITTSVTVIVVIILTLLTTPIYSATATLRVATASNGIVSYSDYMYADRLVNTYVKLATSGPILRILAEKIGITQIPEIKVTPVPNTELIQITANSPDPMLSQSVANGLGEILVAKGKELYSGKGESPSEILHDQLDLAERELKQARQDYEALSVNRANANQEIAAAQKMIDLRESTYASLLQEYDQARLRDALQANTITMVVPAVVPIAPSRPRVGTNIFLGFVVGLCSGIGLAFLYENLNTRLYTCEQIEEISGLKLLSKIPSTKQEFLSVTCEGDHPENLPLDQAFLRLRTNVLIQAPNGLSGGMSRSFVLTSAEQGEGKSTIASHLAMAIARAEQKVILVDADMRLPTLHEMFNLPNSHGLSDILKEKAHVEDVLQRSHVPGLKLITSGLVPTNPSELLGSPRMGTLIRELYGYCDILLIDTPAFLPVADAAILAPLIDSVILVVRRVYVRLEAMREVCKQLEDLSIRPIGIVINEAEKNGKYYKYRRN